ncbi:MAG TPA: 6-pyruvoyl-tetrahydropterin synthase-related protein [Gemmataceae bacterium]|nr:6-pyruvoyl-tetrahydropterin synthase-related protein [Gemmataceae bacterium]
MAPAAAALVARYRRPAAALLLYTLLAVALMAPLASTVLPDTPAQDLANHVSGIIEAGNALAEGQFPIRVSPHQCHDERYPTFQFYGNLPYTAGGLLYHFLGVRPFAACKLLLLLALTGGAFYTFRCARLLTGAHAAAVVAGAVFVTAPYMLTDIHGRAAVTEALAFNLLPVVLFYALRAFSGRPAAVLLGALAWAALALTHNITFFYGSFFFGGYFLLHALWRRERLRGLVHVGIAYGLGLVLTAWYIAPQLYLLHDLDIAQRDWKVVLSSLNWLTPLGVLLAPTLVLPRPYPAFDNLRFGLQVGWPVLGAVWLAVGCVRRAGGRRADVLRLLLLFAVAFVLVWAPLDLWRWMPRLFTMVQYSYRLLMFCALWGALLAAHALAVRYPRGLRTEQLLLVVLVLGLFAAPYLAVPYSVTGQVSEDGEIHHPDIGRGGNNENYVLGARALKAAALAPRSPFDTVLTAEATRKATRYGQPTVARLHLDGPSLVQLPVLFYPRLLRVRDNGRTVPYGAVGKYLALPLGLGDHVIQVRFLGLRWANRLSLGGCALVLLAFAALGVRACRRRLRGPPPRFSEPRPLA